MNNIVENDSGATTLFNVDNNSEQCGPHNVVQSCSYQSQSYIIIPGGLAPNVWEQKNEARNMADFFVLTRDKVPSGNGNAHVGRGM